MQTMNPTVKTAGLTLASMQEAGDMEAQGQLDMRPKSLAKIRKVPLMLHSGVSF